MLRERPHPGGWLTLVSPKLEAIGVPHGFTTAVGPGPERWSVKSAEDMQGVLRGERLNDRRVAMGRQVHQARVTTPAVRHEHGCDEADAHVTDQYTEVVAVRTADCVPLLLSRADGFVVAAVHAGWRGLQAGVIAEALGVVALRGDGPVDASACVAAIGPCIGVDAYEVGEEVASQFSFGVARRDDWPKPHIDLRGIALRQLLDAGVSPDRIDVATQCTFAEVERFGSYRRDGRGCGHQAAFIGPIHKP